MSASTHIEGIPEDTLNPPLPTDGPIGSAQDKSGAEDAEGGSAWLNRQERGSILGIRIMLFLAVALGRRVTRVLLRAVILHYAILYIPARRASRLYLERVQDEKVTFWMIYRHLLTFGFVTLDRIFLLKGRHEHFQVTTDGEEHLRELVEKKRGAILLGAHLGSFEAMSMIAQVRSIRINILAYRGNARKINALLRTLNPEANTRVLEIEPGNFSSLLKVRELISAGEIVAILGDRVGLNSRVADATFLGHSAPFPTGPYLIASLTGCPVYLTFGIYQDATTYALHCTPFREKVTLPRGAAKTQVLNELAQDYASTLERMARKHPYNWFNFFDFWSSN